MKNRLLVLLAGNIEDDKFNNKGLQKQHCPNTAILVSVTFESIHHLLFIWLKILLVTVSGGEKAGGGNSWELVCAVVFTNNYKDFKQSFLGNLLTQNGPLQDSMWLQAQKAWQRTHFSFLSPSPPQWWIFSPPLEYFAPLLKFQNPYNLQ